MSRGRSPPLALVVQMQVAEVDHQTEGLPEGKHRIVAMNGVNGQYQATGDAEVPKGDRDDDLLGLFARPPL